MKISINDEELILITDLEKRVFAHEMLTDVDEELKSRLRWAIMHKFINVFERFKKEWDVKLAQRGVAMIPTDRETYAQLVFSQPDYKSRAQREVASANEEMARLQAEQNRDLNMTKAQADIARGPENAPIL